jgi:ATP-dependent helicase/nuclease subunit A
VPDEVARAAATLVNHKNKKPSPRARHPGLAGAATTRARGALGGLARLFFTKARSPRRVAATPYGGRAGAAGGGAGRLAGCRLLAATEALLALATRARPLRRRKRGAGLMAYDDLIAHAERVLRDPGSAWVLFKLDGGLDHVLLDEAQDSNPAQWRIAAALTEEFFAGQGTERAAPCRKPRRAAPLRLRGGRHQAVHLRLPGRRHRRLRHLGQRLRAARPRERRRVPPGPAHHLLPLHRAGAGAGGRGVRRGRGPPGRGAGRRGSAAPPRRPRGHAGAVELWPLLRRAAKPKPLPWLVPEQPEQVADAPALLAEAGRRAHRPHAAPRAPARALRPPPLPATGAETLEARPSAPATCWCWSAAAPPSCSAWCAP